MKVAVEEISSVKKSLKIEVPEEVVTKELSSAYTDLNQRVRIPGFRPGKAPRAMLEQRYAATVEEDVIRRLVPDYYQRAIQETGLRRPVLVRPVSMCPFGAHTPAEETSARKDQNETNDSSNSNDPGMRFVLGAV